MKSRECIRDPAAHIRRVVFTEAVNAIFKQPGKEMSPRSRGAIRPGCGFIFRPKRAWKRRAPNAPAASRAGKGRKHTSVVTTDTPQFTRRSARNDFNSLFRALPGDRAVLPPSPHGYWRVRARL